MCILSPGFPLLTQFFFTSFSSCMCRFLSSSLLVQPGRFVQNERRVFGLWRHAPCCRGHRQEAGELITGPARFIHQATERHRQNPPLGKSSRTVHINFSVNDILAFCVRPRMWELNLSAHIEFMLSLSLFFSSIFIWTLKQQFAVMSLYTYSNWNSKQTRTAERTQQGKCWL